MLKTLYSFKSWKLGFLTFSAGAVIMALELVSSRILTPVFGSSTYTWGSLIGVILTGLSVGYFLGGKISDKNPTIEKITSIVFSGGLYITVIPFFAPSAIEFSISMIKGSQFTPLLATLMLLVFPSILLGFVSPYMIKLGTKTLHNVGNISGNLYSVATIGSIVGTFVTVFVLIPVIEVTQIIFGLGIALMACSLVGLKAPTWIIVACIIIVFVVPWSSLDVSIIPHPIKPLYEKETQYNHLDVIDSDNYRSLYLNGLRHSSMDRNDPTKLVIDYTEYFHLGKALNPEFKNVLFVGGGGFSGPKNFLLLYPELRVDVVEIDADVIDVAKKYFAVKDNPRLRIFNEDARTFLSKSNDQYDLIILDAYATDYVPYHLMTSEFFKIVESKLTPNGVVISNLIGSLEGQDSDLLRSVYKTMQETFPTMFVFLTEHNIASPQNVMLVATTDERTLDREKLSQITKKYSISYLVDDFERDEHFFAKTVNTNDVPILTDQYAPVEGMLNPVTHLPYMKENLTYDSQQQKDEINKIIVIGLLSIIIMIWGTYFVIIWKRPIINHECDLQM